MPLAVRYSTETMQAHAVAADVTTRCIADPGLMARLQDRTVDEIARRLADGHRAYVAFVRGVPAAFRESTETLTECWRCVRAGRTAHYCPPGACRCDYQKKEIPCHEE